MSKIYLLENVYEAAIKRLQFVKRNFDKIVVAFSGGKDSTLSLYLALEVFRNMSVYFWDKESNLISTANFVKDTFDNLPNDITPYWFCLEYRMRNAFSVYEPYWYCWDKTRRSDWIYDPPNRDYVIMDPQGIKNYDPDKHNLYKLFGDYISEDGKYRTAVIVGLRADESLNRYRAVSKNPQMGKDWMTLTNANNVYNVYPIYDWSFGDVWTYISRNKIQYAPIYDNMLKAGLYKKNMRISQSFCDVSKDGVEIIRKIEPESFERWINRVSGVNSLTHLDMSDILEKSKDIDFDFIMQLYPDKVRESIEKKLERSPTLEGNDDAVKRALLDGDIRLKRVNRNATKRSAETKDKWEGV